MQKHCRKQIPLTKAAAQLTCLLLRIQQYQKTLLPSKLGASGNDKDVNEGNPQHHLHTTSGRAKSLVRNHFTQAREWLSY